MSCGREILLRNVKYALRRVEIFHLNEIASKSFDSFKTKILSKDRIFCFVFKQLESFYFIRGLPAVFKGDLW